MGESLKKPWRTNIGLRLSAELGEWMENHCQAENRTFANFVETLVMRERDRLASQHKDAPNG